MMSGQDASEPSGHHEKEEHDSEPEITEGNQEPPAEHDVKPTDRETDKSIGAAGLDPI